MLQRFHIQNWRTRRWNDSLRRISRRGWGRIYHAPQMWYDQPLKATVRLGGSCTSNCIFLIEASVRVKLAIHKKLARSLKNVEIHQVGSCRLNPATATVTQQFPSAKYRPFWSPDTKTEKAVMSWHEFRHAVNSAWVTPENPKYCAMSTWKYRTSLCHSLW